jgi:hypothetical protein
VIVERATDRAADHEHVIDHRRQLVLADLQGHGVGVAVGHQAGGGAVAGYPEAARVGDDHEKYAHLLQEHRADPGARDRHDDRLAGTQRGLEPVKHLALRGGTVAACSKVLPCGSGPGS